LSPVIQSIRPPFLVLTPIVVFVSLSVSLWLGYEPKLLVIIYALIGAMAAHVSVNTFNEYFDHESGLDANTQRTPFSGGSGALQESPHHAIAVRDLAMASFIICVFIGAFFVWLRGPLLIPLGVVGLLLVVFYTNWVTRHPLMCLLAPGLAFGPIVIIGSYIAITGQYVWPPVLASLLVFFQVNNLLLLNQYPDIAADKAAGRRHWLIVYGARSGLYVYALFAALAYVPIIIAVGLNYLPATTLLVLLTVPMAAFCVFRLTRHVTQTVSLEPALAVNVATCLLTPLLLSVGLLLD
jgi:1,4-dihydroxy-2-naphthoate octaprenyltransferase